MVEILKLGLVKILKPKFYGEVEIEVERDEVRVSPPLAVMSADSKVCEYCGGSWTDNALSSTMCVDCTAKLWRGEIVNKNNEFEKYDKIAFIKL